MILLCPALNRQLEKRSTKIQFSLTAMLHDLYFDPRLILFSDVQEQAIIASYIRTCRIVAEHFCTDHFCLMVRDVHICLGVDELKCAHSSLATTTILACRGPEEIWLSRKSTIVSSQTLCGGPFVCHAARKGRPYAREWSEWTKDGNETAEAVGQ